MKHDELTYGESLKILDNFGVICLPGDVHKNARNLIKHLKRQNELLEACKALLQEAEYREKQGEPWGFSIDSARTAIARADGGE